MGENHYGGGWLHRLPDAMPKPAYVHYATITRNHTAAPTNDADVIVRRAVALLDKTEAGRRPVRLLGAGVHGLCQRGADDDTLLF